MDPRFFAYAAEMSLTIREFSKTYPDGTKALDNVSLSIVRRREVRHAASVS